MKILIYGINYSPELTGIGKYTGEMGSWLACRGHEVHVVTALPYYPEWEVHEQYKGKKWFTEILNGVNVHRIPLYVPKEVSSKKRIIHEFSFILNTIPFLFSSLFKFKFEIIICIAPPFHLGLLPLLYSKIKRVSIVYHVQDLQIDAARDLGMLKSTFFLKLMFSLERFILKKVSKVSTISLGMQRKIEAKGIADEKILQFPNWVDIDFMKPLPKEESLRSRFGLGMEEKVVLYSGNLGEKQGLEVILEIAEQFLNSDTSVKFVICGNGGARERLVKEAEYKELTNVIFFPLQPYEDLPALLSTADLHLVLQKASASDLVMPSKLTGIFAAGGVPVVTALPNTSLYEIISSHTIGFLCPPEDVTGLYETVKNALNTDKSDLKRNSRVYAEHYLSKDSILKQFEYDLNKIIE